MALAAAEPGSLVLAVDPVVGAMAESSRRARKSANNVIFVAASAESFAADLPSVAHRVVLNFPWGSLLRGVLGLDRAVGAAIGSVVRPGGSIVALVSVTARDGVAGLDGLDLAHLRACPPAPDLALVHARAATPEEVRETRSTWGQRLLAGAGAARPIWRVEWRRATPDAGLST